MLEKKFLDIYKLKYRKILKFIPYFMLLLKSITRDASTSRNPPLLQLRFQLLFNYNPSQKLHI
jgi:hypothetical protein